MDNALLMRIRSAYVSADLDSISDLLDPHVRWGIPGDPVPACQSRLDVVKWYKRSRAAGARAEVLEVLEVGGHVLIGLEVTRDSERQVRWQLLTLQHGLITEIAGFDSKDDAVTAATTGDLPELGPRWPIAPPTDALHSEATFVRAPQLADAGELHRHALVPGRLADGWLPLAESTSLSGCESIVHDWRAGWDGAWSFHGPAFVVADASDAVIGHIGMRMNERGAVELAYGIAPDSRQLGHATRAVRLVADWLLAQGEVMSIEAIIAPTATHSQRVAVAAGMTPDAVVRQHVEASGESYSDLRFVRSR
jgi:RimJ/RimL family protein N-acetyltransferase